MQIGSGAIWPLNSKKTTPLSRTFWKSISISPHQKPFTNGLRRAGVSRRFAWLLLLGAVNNNGSLAASIWETGGTVVRIWKDLVLHDRGATCDCLCFFFLRPLPPLLQLYRGFPPALPTARPQSTLVNPSILTSADSSPTHSNPNLDPWAPSPPSAQIHRLAQRQRPVTVGHRPCSVTFITLLRTRSLSPSHFRLGRQLGH
jgi:hypothetical protein